MRRWFAILMLALLPLQFSWAAVAAYCGHESGDAAQHMGHHEHQHADEADAHKLGPQGGEMTSAGSDFDCGHCHVSWVTILEPLRELPTRTLAPHPAMSAEGIVRTLPQSPPDRPQWRPLA